MKWLWWAFLPIGGLAVLIGIEFWKLESHSKISYSLDFGSVLDAFVLLVVFILIDYAYSKQSSKKRADTDLLLSIVAEARIELRKVEEKSQSCEQSKPLSPKEQFALTLAERDLSNAVHSIEEALRHCSIDMSKLRFESVKDARVEIKEALTDTPYPGPYDSGSLGRIRTSLKTMRDELTRITFAINHR